jgi:tetratricopeptide (TPR) repeat protein
VVTATTAACAARTPPATPTAPAFPDVAMPDVPAALQASRSASAHEAAWRQFQTGDVGAAERDYRRLLRESPDFYPSAAALGYLELARKDAKAALEHFAQALALDGRYLPALLGRGEALLRERRDADALEAFEAALAVDASLADVRRRVDLLRFSRLEEALADAQRAEREGRLDAARAAYLSALEASPESGLIHRRLGEVERRRGDLAEAEAHARRALAADAYDAAAHVLLANVLDASGDAEGALAAWESAERLDPAAGAAERADALRQRLALARLPPAYRAIETTAVLTRAQLASLIGIRLRPIVDLAARTRTAVVTDALGHWALPWITVVTERGLMNTYADHSFQPEAPVSRADFAQVAARLLQVLGAREPRWLQEWQAQPVAFVDLDPRHLSFPAASLAVAAGVMQSADRRFAAVRAVSGRESLGAVERLESLMARAGLGLGGRAPDRR